MLGPLAIAYFMSAGCDSHPTPIFILPILHSRISELCVSWESVSDLFLPGFVHSPHRLSSG